jgi:choline dehydrogenase-like flavoprotein
LVLLRINWNFLSEGEPGTGNRQLQWPRGKTLGGTSSINGMLYVRGNPADYDNWAQMGCRGWSYEGLPFFRKSETYRGKGDPEFRSRGGPLIVEDYRTISTDACLCRSGEAGLRFAPGLNRRSSEPERRSRDGQTVLLPSAAMAASNAAITSPCVRRGLSFQSVSGEPSAVLGRHGHP